MSCPITASNHSNRYKTQQEKFTEAVGQKYKERKTQQTVTGKNIL